MEKGKEKETQMVDDVKKTGGVGWGGGVEK